MPPAARKRVSHPRFSSGARRSHRRARGARKRDATGSKEVRIFRDLAKNPDSFDSPGPLSPPLAGTLRLGPQEECRRCESPPAATGMLPEAVLSCAGGFSGPNRSSCGAERLTASRRTIFGVRLRLFRTREQHFSLFGVCLSPNHTRGGGPTAGRRPRRRRRESGAR